MSLVSFARNSITIIRPGRFQDRGSWYDDWENPEPERTIPGCVVFPGRSVEDNDFQEAQEVTYTVLVPLGTDILASDKVRVDLEPGLDLAVFGRPRQIPSPTGNLGHIHLELTDWKVTS